MIFFCQRITKRGLFIHACSTSQSIIKGLKEEYCRARLILYPGQTSLFPVQIQIVAHDFLWEAIKGGRHYGDIVYWSDFFLDMCHKLVSSSGIQFWHTSAQEHYSSVKCCLGHILLIWKVDLLDFFGVIIWFISIYYFIISPLSGKCSPFFIFVSASLGTAAALYVTFHNERTNRNVLNSDNTLRTPYTHAASLLMLGNEGAVLYPCIINIAEIFSQVLSVILLLYLFNFACNWALPEQIFCRRYKFGF